MSIKLKYYHYCSIINKLKGLTWVFLVLYISGCVTQGVVRVSERPVEEQIDGISGVGIESQDIDKMTRQIVEEILELNLIPISGSIPRIIIDSSKFVNESSQVINTNLLVDRLRIGLLREARGGLLFISRENSDSIIEEAKITGTLEFFPADYRIIGKITSISSYSERSGIRSNFVQVSFELIDLRTSAIVWGNFYQVKKIGSDDTIYR